ncbi:probable tyrosine-protein kinase DDB_G0283397 [Chelonus insularis]|uniref:probable tyrosine-protein kinase DDB_G0283397 n=1 Tax=Chelonus insularis TaxID=460826 RepID=UPI001589718A|nr:probable tyrosine-protein kinase DDB_G0283397 [Chelonus insularis]
MGMTGMFKWLRKDALHRGRSRQSLPPNLSFNNDSYRSALQEFLARRKNPDDPGYITSPNTTISSGYEFLSKNESEIDISNLTVNQSIREKVDNYSISIPGIPHAQLADLFEIGWISGTEDRNIEVIYAEWQNIRVSLRRNVHKDCLGAIDRDIVILSQIRHQNIMILMGTTQTVDNHLVAICEPVDCTLYHFVHEQNEKLSVQSVAKNSGSLASALQYAHMRGYIHSAVNPHCVFLTISGIVKLGGWELAIENDKTFPEEQSYEDCVRSEIFQWQAPELFKGQRPTIATDVFGLALLTWELCTGVIPWADLSKEDVEKQYLQLGQGVSIKAYNFPRLLKTFLESGLQLDARRRSLDMMNISRYFQRLELQYENKELFYIDQQSINGNDTYNNSRLSINSAPLISRGNLSQLFGSNEQFSSRENIQPSPIKRIPSERKNIEPRKLFPRIISMNRSLDIDHMRNIGLIRENANNNRNEKLNQNLSHRSSSPKDHDTERKDSSSRTESSVIQEDTSNTRIDIQNLKEILANRRRSFFSSNTTVHNSSEHDGLDKSSISGDKFNKSSISGDKFDKSSISGDKFDKSSISGDKFDKSSILEDKLNKSSLLEDRTNKSSFLEDRLDKSSLLEEIKSRDYKPHKPASHKTSIEPKLNTSLHKHYSTFIKSTQPKSSKLPYSYVPGSVRDAVIQPQVLNTSSQSFFETSLWSKEKSLYLSKSRNHDSMLSENKSSISPDSDQTYTIKSSIEQVRHENLNRTSGAELNTDKVVMKSMTKSTSLQALKDTLERVTNLVKLNSSNTVGKINDSNKCNSINVNISKRNESSSLEESFNLNEKVDEKIQTIERSSSQRYFTVNLRKTFKDNERKSPINGGKLTYISISSKKHSSPERPRPTSVELKTALECGLPIIRNKEEYNVIERRYKTKTLDTPSNTSSKCTMDVENDRKFDLLNTNNKIDENKFGLHSEIILARRRSLPPNLGELKRASSDFVINRANKDANLNDSVLEDFYIDDEFNENNLAPNMILLDADSTAGSHDIFSDLPENYFGTL